MIADQCVQIATEILGGEGRGDVKKNEILNSKLNKIKSKK